VSDSYACADFSRDSRVTAKFQRAPATGTITGLAGTVTSTGPSDIVGHIEAALQEENLQPDGCLPFLLF
jgi:hypothetical protein